MGVVCCETSPKLAHQDGQISSMSQDPSSSATAVSASTATLPSDLTANVGHNDISRPVDQANHNTSTKSHTHKTRKAKKTVRMNDEVTIIPMLTSSSFIRKTPKTTTITYMSYGIMPSFRIVTPDTIKNGEGSDPQDDDDDLVSKESLWWTKVERREIIQANQKVSRDFKRFQPTKLRKANLIYNDIVMDCCCRNDGQDNDEDYDDNDIYDFFQRKRLNGRIAASATTTSTSSTTSTTTGATSRTNVPTKKRKRMELSPTILYHCSDLPPPKIPNETIDLPNNVRGLEWGVMPDAKRYRKAHARTVLRWQDRFRKMNDPRRHRRNGHNCQQDKGHQDDEDFSARSSSSSSSDDDDDIDVDEKTSYHRHQQDLLLGYKASISSLRSCMLARVFGKSDEIAANPSKTKASDLEERPSSSWSPTPSLTGTTDDSASSSDSEGDDLDSNDEDYSDNDSEEDEDGPANSTTTTCKSLVNRGGYYSSSLSSMNTNSHRRMFRPRMMPTYR